MDTLQDLDLAVQDPDPPPDPSSTPLELRVLSGLQAGAALPLDQPLLVGRSDECDLLLLDDHAPPHLLEIAVEAGGWLQLTALHDGLRLEDGTPLAGTVSLEPGQPFGMERLWLEVQPVEAPWAAWIDPAERGPASRELPDSEDGSDSADGFEGLAADDAREPLSPSSSSASSSSSSSRPPSGMSGELDDWLISADGDDSPFHTAPARRRPASAGDAASSSTSPWRRRWKTWGIIGAGGLLTAGGLLAMAMQLGLPALPGAVSAAMSATQAHAVQPRAADTTPSDGSTRTGSGNETDPPKRSVSSAIDPPDPAPILLPGRNDRVRTGGGVTVVRGDVDITLPFEVREVVLGARSRVVLTSGQVLLPGEAVGRWRLMEIKAGSLVFDGPQRVLLPW